MHKLLNLVEYSICLVMCFILPLSGWCIGVLNKGMSISNNEIISVTTAGDAFNLNGHTFANSATWHGPLEIAADCTIKNGTIRNNSLTGDALVTITGGNVVFEDVTFDCSGCSPQALIRIAFGSKANVTFKGNCRFLAANKNVDAIYVDYCTSGKVTFDDSFTGYVGGKVTLAYESTHPNDDPAVEVSIAGSGTFENAIALDGGKYAFSNSSVLISGGKFAVAPKVSNVEFGYSSAKDSSGYWAVNARGNILSPDANKEIGYALGLPELDWKAVGDWQVQTTNTIDGMGVEIPVGTSGKEALLAVEINGPAFLAFRYRPVGYELFEVFEDGVSIWKYNAGWAYDWQEEILDIPDGMHTVMFNVKTADYSYYGNVGFDDFRIYNVRQPVIKPAAGKSSEDACGFVDEQMIEIESSEPDMQLYYTLDGSDPTGANAILYDGPFFINDSTVVKTVALSPDKGFSMVSTGCFAERSCPVAGRWTRYGDGAIEAAKINGRMVFFLSRMSWCYYGGQIYTAALSETFSDWASANGIYMVDVIQDNVTADSESVYKRVWPLWEQLDEYDGYMRSPFSVFTSGADANTAIGAMAGYTTTSGKRFSETPESLMVCLGSYLGMERLLAAPIASVTEAYSNRTFPFSVTLSNTNGTGSIYYTLDGTAPTRENGIRYTGTITIPDSGTTLKAIVWPNGADAVSGIPLSITYESFADAIGAKGVVWQNDAARPWSLSRTSSDVVVSRGKDENLSSGTSQSTLRAVVDGPGTFHFGGWFNPMNGTLEFRKDGETLRSWHLNSYNFETNVVVSASGKTTFEWVYVSSYYDIAYSNNNPRCELKGISWRPMKAPSAPEDFAVSQGVHEYGTLLRWAAQEGHVSYSIYRGESNSFPEATLIGRTEKNLYWDVECEAGRAYWYWVKAINEYGESGLSSAVSGWRPVVYSVSYDANGGGGYMAPQRITAGVSVTIPECAFRLRGHVFIGWATNTLGDAVYKPGDSVVLQADMSLYAVWEVPSFDFGGDAEWLHLDDGTWQSGTIGNNEESWIQKSVSGPGVISFDWKASSEAGFDQLSFYIDGRELSAISGLSERWESRTFEISDSESHILMWRYAKDGSLGAGLDCGWVRNVTWEPPHITVSFNANGGTGVMEDQVFTSEVAQALKLNIFVRRGYVFAGWALFIEGGVVYGDGESVVNVYELTGTDVTLYAMWRPINYCVRYNANGGAGEMSDQMIVYDEETSFLINRFTKPGSLFKGWAVSANGNSMYRDGADVKNLSAIEGDVVTLYAVWQEKPDWVLDCESSLGGAGKVSLDGNDNIMVTLTNDVLGTVEIPDNVGVVTIDLNGHSMVGDDGPAIRIVKGGGEGEATRLAIVDTSEGEKGQISGGGESAGIEMDKDVASGVRIDVEDTVNVFNGDGTKQSTEPTPTPAPTPEPGPEPTPEPVVVPDLYEAVEGAAPTDAASEYNGYLYDDKSGAVKGTIQVKVGKPGKKDGKATVKATVVVGTKKIALKGADMGKAAIASDEPTEIELVGKGAEECSVLLGAYGITGYYGAYVIDGARNIFSSKDKGDLADAKDALDKCLGSRMVIWDGGSVSVSIAAKGKVKVSGTLASGAKVSATAVLLVGEEWNCVSVAAPRANLSFVLWLSRDGKTTMVEGLGDDVLVGKAGTLADGAAFRVPTDAALWSAIPGEVLTEYLPNGVPVTKKGTKWTLPKVGRITMKKGVIDVSKAGENPSGLKLTYKSLDGTFKGSFKVYAENKG